MTDRTKRDRLAEAAKGWALALTGQASVTGSEGEAAFGPWLAERLKAHAAFGDNPEIWTMPVGQGDPRHCVFMLLRGRTCRTVILTGHYDTVSVDDYGDLQALATDPVALAPALAASLGEQAGTPAMVRARADLAGGQFLPGRGLLDMKAGLAAGFAACEAFAQGDGGGSLLFIAVPDEENNSAGARAVAQALPGIAEQRGLDLVAAINLDAIADDGDGSEGRVIALGTVGKLLPTALVIGTAAHSGFPLNGLNAGALAAAIAARVEWAVELTDDTAGPAGTPPSLLSLRDTKTAYDVTTPARAFASFNVLSFRRAPAEVLDRFDGLCRDAAQAHVETLRGRMGANAAASMPTVALHRYADVEAAALAAAPENAALLRDLGNHLAGTVASLPERCRIKTERAWNLSGLRAPAIVTGFGSIPYLPTNLSSSSNAHRLREAARRTAEQSLERHGSPVSCTPYFAGISDVSFLGEADAGSLPVVAANTPLWRESVRWPQTGGIANIPTINIGPWGRDYHTPLERLHASYAFEVLPGLLLDILAELGIMGEDRRLPEASGAASTDKINHKKQGTLQ